MCGKSNCTVSEKDSPKPCDWKVLTNTSVSRIARYACEPLVLDRGLFASALPLHIGGRILIRGGGFASVRVAPIHRVREIDISDQAVLPQQRPRESCGRDSQREVHCGGASYGLYRS